MKEGTIAVTMQLKQIIQNFASRNPEQLEFLIQDIIAKQSSLVENLGKLKDVDQVKILLDLCDEAIKEERSKSKYSKDIQCDNCNKAYCCQIFCSVSVPETKYIMLDLNIYSIGMLKSWLGDKAWERLSAQVELYQSMKDATAEKHEEAYGSLSIENRRCVFLGEDNLCRVYENRPINCRKHLVLSDKDDCNWQPESNAKSQKTVNFASVNAEIIATYTHRFSKPNLPLSLAIFESFGVCQ